MNRIKTIIAFFLATVLGCAAQTWDILDKSMAAYDKDGASATDKVWEVYQAASAGGVIVQKDTYVNFKKTIAGTTSRWAWVHPKAPIAAPVIGQVYSIEVKACVHPVDIADDGTLVEANQISLRLGDKKIATPIYLRYGDGVTGGSVNISASTANAYRLNTAEWQVYRLVLHANHKFYDVFVKGVESPIFENVPVASTSDANGVYFGAESYHRCNIDVEYVRMGTGDFFSRSKIASVGLSAICHPRGTEKTVEVTVETMLVPDGTDLLVSLVDKGDKEVVPAVKANVIDNKTTATLTIPATLPNGEYGVKVAAPGGMIGEVVVRPRTADYRVTSIDFSEKNLVTFGNSITIAANSWAYHMKYMLGFGHLYNGAFSGARWYKSATVAQDGDSIWTQDYTDPKFEGMRSNAGSNRSDHQKFINNCAVVHVQKYLKERDKNRYPHYIIMAYGTNDVVSDVTMGDASETLKADFNKLNLLTIAGALRWCVDTLRMEFPETKIYVALPLQARSSQKNEGNIKKIAVITEVCDGLGVPYFDCYNESGITQANEAQYLSDGLHPNAAGQALHGAYISRKLDEAVSAEPAGVVQKTVGAASVAVSTTLLNTGQTLSVRSLKQGIDLSEVVLYGMYGNEVFRLSTQGATCQFQVPQAAGAYILTVGLADNTSQGFKIMVK